MIYYLQTTLIIFIEMMCCLIFFSTFCNIPKQKKFLFILASFNFLIAIIFQDKFISKQFLIICTTSIIMKLQTKEPLKKFLFYHSCFKVCF